MATPPLASALTNAVGTNAADERPPSPKSTVVSSGVGSGDSSLAPAPSSSNAAAVPVAVTSSANAPAPQAEAPKAAVAKGTIQIEKKGLFGRTSTKDVDLDAALAKKLITPEQAIAKNYCQIPYLTARGYGNVKFNYAGKRGEAAYDGDLKTALKKGYITIEKAIERDFITKEQAIEGGFLKG